MNNPPVKILLVEDHKLMRVGLKSLFEELDGLEVISEAQSGKEAVEKYKITHPDVTLMDIGLPDISGIEATKRVIEHSSLAKVIMLTSHISEQEVTDSLHAGACAYVMKDINIEILKMIIKTVKEGAMWLDPQVVPILRDKNCGVVPPRQMSRAMFKE